METIIIHPKDKAELNFFLELAQRLGTNITTIDQLHDKQLLKAMEENLATGETDKENIMNTLNNILNEDQASYNDED
jgi:predicted nucleic acid-binding protein